MRKNYSGFCPTQNVNYTISITYVDASLLEGAHYEKGTFNCEFKKQGNYCNGNACPIYKDAPQEIH